MAKKLSGKDLMKLGKKELRDQVATLQALIDDAEKRVDKTKAKANAYKSELAKKNKVVAELEKSVDSFARKADKRKAQAKSAQESVQRVAHELAGRATKTALDAAQAALPGTPKNKSTASSGKSAAPTAASSEAAPVQKTVQKSAAKKSAAKKSAPKKAASKTAAKQSAAKKTASNEPTVAQLRDQARSRGITNYSRMTKAQLKTALS